MSLMMSLPKELIVDCIARVPRCYLPTLSLVCKLFRSIVASPELYTRRSLLGCPDCYIYVTMLNISTIRIIWYVLEKKTPGRTITNNCLVSIPSLPPMPLSSSLAVDGSKIFVIGGCENYHKSSVFVINCPSNTLSHAGFMPRYVSSAQSAILDGKIYIFRDRRIMVFDTEKQTWEEFETMPEMEMEEYCQGCVAMSGKIYIRAGSKSFIYDPKEGKWEMDEIFSSQGWDHSCVIDDVLYHYCRFGKKLHAYDSKNKCWEVVKGVEVSHEELSWSCMTRNFGKLVLFFQVQRSTEKTKEIWGAEIALKRQGGEIWGRIEWCNIVLNNYDDYLDNCVAVSV